ncbi:MAG: heparinase II/III family protein [Pirellulales bacterium]|nr:heparinase II/III family protein [Pirellulales bacterium]
MRTTRLAAILGIAVCGAVLAPPPPAWAEDSLATILFDMDTVRHQPTTGGEGKTPIGAVELVPGKVGQACQFTFHDGAQSGFFTASVRPSAAWDEAAGLSFWVKGDGSSSFGGLELIDSSNYGLRYACCFPIDSTEWRRITVPWCDLVPELPAGQPIDPQAGYRPSGFGNLWFGKWYYWREYPACSFAIDQVALEPEIAVDQTDYTPLQPGAPRVLAKLKAGQPVTIVTMGDSLTDKRHWANREILWAQRMAAQLKQRFGSEVTLVNPAIGGTQLTQNLVLMPRWLGGAPPDLVTVWFGFNDWDAGMRGPHFRTLLGFAVDRIRRMTGGRSDVMLITTCPAVARWDTMEELAEAVRAVAAEKKTALADVSAAMHQAAADEPARLELFAWDKTHLGPAGHELAAATVVDAIIHPPNRSDPPPPGPAADSPQQRPRSVPEHHPRLFGSRSYLQRLADQRADAYRRVVGVARGREADDHAKLVSMALVCAIERDGALGRQAVGKVLQSIEGPIPQGHTPFAHTLARCAIVYDLCHECWTPPERDRFHEFLNRTVDANVESETHVFHNGWYGYKNWGIGLGCYATYYENPRAAEILDALEQEFRSRAAEALKLAGDGGGWAEGYYIHYWLYEWLFFCECARLCDGTDYYALADEFFRDRAIAGMFETFPGVGVYGSRRPIPMGDGGGRVFGGDRDKALSARRILANYYRDDPAHQAVHAFNETTPRSSVGAYAYKDFLWRDPTLKQGDLASFRLSHFSPGAGYVYARSSWDEDATCFFFKCGDRFTAHQHLDVGHFLIYRQGELVGDGGHYDGFGTPHDVNYHLRSIAHNTILINDPSETWPNIRAGRVTGNDGGQHHNWPHHNGAVTDADAWQKDRPLYDIADVPAFEDHGDWLYVAGDCTRAYSPNKLDCFTRQIVYLRPGTFVVFDRVAARDPAYKKTWLLQAVKRPEGTAPNLVVSNGQGRLRIQTLLPATADVKLVEGDDLYSYGGHSYPPSRDTGPAPECRIEVSPPRASKVDYFLHVLTAIDASAPTPPGAHHQVTDTQVHLTLGEAEITFGKTDVGGSIDLGAGRREFP